MVDRSVVYIADTRDKAVLEFFQNFDGSPVWLNIYGEIENPPKGEWADEAAMFDFNQGCEFSRRSMKFAQEWFICDGKDVTLYDGVFSIGDLISYFLHEMLVPVIKKIAALDKMNPENIITLKDNSRAYLAALEYASSRRKNLIEIKPLETKSPEKNIGLKEIPEQTEKILKILSRVSKIKAALLPPPKNSRGIFSLSADASARVREDGGFTKSRCHLVLPLEMFKPRDLLSRKIYWARASYNIAPRRFDNVALELSQNQQIKKRFVYNGINLWNILGKEIIEMVSGWQGAIDAVKKEGLFDSLKKLRTKFFLTLQDAALENRLIANWCAKSGVSAILVQHGACREDGEFLSGFFPKKKCDKIFVWGMSAVNFYKAFGYDEKNIKIIGHKKFRDYMNGINASELREKSREKYSLRTDEKVILYIPQVYVSLYGFQDARRNNAEFLEICKAFKEMPHLRLIIRFHPSIAHYEMPVIKREIVQRHAPENTIIDSAPSAMEAMACADGVLGAGSTVMLEAAAMGKVLFEDENEKGNLRICERGAGIPYRPVTMSVKKALSIFDNLSQDELTKIRLGQKTLLDMTIGQSDASLIDYLDELRS